MSPPKGYPTTRAGRAQRSRDAAARRVAREQAEANVRGSVAPETLAPEVSDEAINAAAERARITTDVPPPGYGTAGELEPWEPARPSIDDMAQAEGIAPDPRPLVDDGELLELEGGWKAAQKKGLTVVRRMPGPFEVDTSEGVMRCEDGWLALDTAGNPYPIAAGVFARSYVVVRDAHRPDLEALAPGLAAKVRPA